MAFLSLLAAGAAPVRADGIVNSVISAPVHPNGLVRDMRSGINILLQRPDAMGESFLDPRVVGFGIPSGGRMEIEMVSGFERDPEIPLDEKTLILVTGTPQQGLPAKLTGLNVSQGGNENTYVITAEGNAGFAAEALLSPAPGAAFDPIRQRGIKIIHIGRTSAFISRGDKGEVSVRIFDASNAIVASGKAETLFYPYPRPMIFPTNIPHDQRNHNWQQVGPGQIVGASNNTLPLPLILFDRNRALENLGLIGVGVLSRVQAEELGYIIPKSLDRYSAGLILQDRDGDGLLNPVSDIIIGGMSVTAPDNANNFQVVTPLVSERPFLSVDTGRYNERAGKNVGGAIMQVVFIAGDLPGLYQINFALLENPGDFESEDGSDYTYTVVVE
ncbi:MAG: hypothetical protein AAF217_04040 [Pseudomonadota bacterium]